MTYANGKLVVAWYDQREDASGEYSEFIDEVYPIRRTIDVRVAWADPGKKPNFSDSIQVSRYLFALMPDESVQQVQFNAPNYPLFKEGTQPFISDYVDISPSPMFVPDGSGWKFNTEPSDAPIFHVAWTDNRDVKPPVDNVGWDEYNPPNPIPNSGQSPPDREDPCNPDTTGMRNQNIYTARITKGVTIGIPGNAKPLGTLERDPTIPRTFVIYVNNEDEYIKSFRISLSEHPNIFASFLEFDTQTELDMAVAPHSSISRPIFVTSLNPKDSVTVYVDEIDMPGGIPIPNGYTGSVVINPLANNPDPNPGDTLLVTEYPIITING